MALEPYRVSAEMDRCLEVRTFQLGGHTLLIRQDMASSGSLQPVRRGQAPEGEGPDARAPGPPPGEVGGKVDNSDCTGTLPAAAEEKLDNVGLVVWQSAFVLAEYLLRNPPFQQWADVRVVDLGTGTGVVGIALALAGAEVVLTDLEHILPLTQQNLDANLEAHHRAKIMPLSWGSDVSHLGERPSLITCSDCVYQPQFYAALVDTLVALSAAHTLAFVAYKPRGRREADFEQMLHMRQLAVEVIPAEHLHEEYQDGQYRLLRVCKIDPDDPMPDAEASLPTADVAPSPADVAPSPANVAPHENNVSVSHADMLASRADVAKCGSDVSVSC